MNLLSVLLLLAALAFHPILSNSSAEPDGSESFDFSTSLNGVSLSRAKAIRDPTDDKPTLLFSRMKAIRGSPGQHSAISALRRAVRRPQKDQSLTHDHASRSLSQNFSVVGEYVLQYAIQCTWDSVPVYLLFDTGSSDTWAARDDLKCHGAGACAFGHPRLSGFLPGHHIPDLHFYLTYGSGETVSGPMGYSSLTCGGVTVPKQQVGLANSTLWRGDNVTVGILGLAYPSITSAFYGELGDEAPWNSMQYTPFLTSAISQGSIEPVFSVAVARNSSDGVLAWGGLPPVRFQRDSVAKADLIIANLIDQDDTSWKYSFYTIIPDGFKWGQTTDRTKYPYIVDTGTTMLYLPPPLAEAIANAFQPRAVYLYQWQSYFAPCDALPPLVSVLIGGVEFDLNPADLIYTDLVDPLTGYCAIALASGGHGPYILGDVFLQSVLAVFDVGGAQMRFYRRDGRGM